MMLVVGDPGTCATWAARLEAVGLPLEGDDADEWRWAIEDHDATQIAIALDAGTGPQPLLAWSEASWQAELEPRLWRATQLIQVSAEALLGADGAVVVLLATPRSGADRLCNTFLSGLVATAARELGRTGIRLNAAEAANPETVRFLLGPGSRFITGETLP